jgi:fermentation-respiration switch protein FrsA (DUF1100 family)
MTWVIGSAVLLYLAIVALLWFAESRLIYFPGAERRLTSPPAALNLAIERAEFSSEDGVRLVGWIMPAATGTTGFWLLVCHGNAGNLSQFDRPAHYAALRELGLNLFAFDYRGYGESGGTPSEHGLYRDADAAYRYLREERGVPADRIIVFGHSLGSAVAIDLASRTQTAGLIVEGGLISVVQRGQELYPFIPVRWIARTRFSSIDKIPLVTAPKLFLHAVADEVIPLSHGRRLFQAAAEPKRLVELAGTHSDAFAVDSSRYFGSIAGFMTTLGGRSTRKSLPRSERGDTKDHPGNNQ